MRTSFNTYRMLVLVLLVIALLWGAGYVYKNNIRPQAGNASTVEKISKLIILPADETPTIATVSDLEALKGQPFFADAKVGDIVLIYANAKKAILYDPVLNKIVNATSVGIGSGEKKYNF
jgi:hypothetical protein